MTRLEDTKIEGLGQAYAARLRAQGLDSPEDLLEAAATLKGREELAVATGISRKLLLLWVNRADLLRIKGMGREYPRLLAAVGVDTVPELAQREAHSLTMKIVEVNEERQLVHRVPTEAEVGEWIQEAKKLQPVDRW